MPASKSKLASVTARQQSNTHFDYQIKMKKLNETERSLMAQSQITAAIWSVCQQLANQDQLTPQIASKLFSFGRQKQNHHSVSQYTN